MPGSIGEDMRMIVIKFHGDDEDNNTRIYLSVTDDELDALKTICDRYGCKYD